MTLKVNLEAMVSSAIHVSGQGEDLAVGHTSTDARMAGAEVGWQGTSAAAMSAKLASWTTTSATLLSRISDHSQGLHSTAAGFSTHEEQSRAALQAVGQSAHEARS